ncbi:MAG: hypothetical protein LBD66_02810 [Holosporales bacterium]|jgi:hypothetical protein|nr:hypothetical protein [Holosporales bacterium]
MRFIFDWTKTYADLSTPWRGDEDPFALTITQAEGEFAVAHVTLKNPHFQTCSLHKRAYARIACQKEEKGPILPLFCGRVITVPVALRGALMTIELIAEPDNSAEQLQALSRTLQKAPYWDPLFVSEGAENLPHEVLEARTALFTWNRVNGVLRLSDLYQGRKNVTLETIFSDSLRLHRGPEPWDAVEVTLEVQWTQRATGVFDVAPIVAQQFPGQMLNTYSGKDFQKSWNALTHKLSLGGYNILYHSLEEIFPPETGILHLYPRQSPAFFLWKEEEEALHAEHFHRRPLKAHLKRFWFRGQLILAWRYQQKRREIAHFTLRNHHQLRTFQEKGTPKGHIKCLHLKLNAIAPAQEVALWQGFTLYKEGDRISSGGRQYAALQDHRSCPHFLEDKAFWQDIGALPMALGDASRASFFTTTRGQSAVLHALARARSYLAASSRSFELSFRGTFAELAPLTTEDTVVLKDPRLPGGQVQGKVIKTHLVVDGKTQTYWGEIRLACGVGWAEQPPSEGYQLGTELYVESDYAELGVYQQEEAMRIEDIEIEDFSRQLPTQGFAGSAEWDVRDLISGLQITNPPEEQERFLSQQRAETPFMLLAHLKKCCTTIRLDLRNLCTKTLLTHIIPITLLSSWSAPKGVTFEEEVS